MNEFETLKNSKTALEQKREAIKAQIRAVNRELSDLENLPIGRAEFKELMHCEVDQTGGQYNVWLEHLLGSFLPRRAIEGSLKRTVPFFGTATNADEIFPQAVACLLQKELKAAVSKTIDGMEWPAHVAPPKAERAVKKEQLSQELVGLQKKLSDFDKKAAEAGFPVPDPFDNFLIRRPGPAAAEADAAQGGKVSTKAADGGHANISGPALSLHHPSNSEGADTAAANIATATAKSIFRKAAALAGKQQ
jgi:hypothetical protein